ncbi:integral membrane protein S linking to the trans Golgi network-domain-containing protein [Russula ochroleuca]|uniref:Integral membrane protein S linking to the trans Golgi network-domain-containing protein n=1 Tax=Russula ochroleuca TaxID=152965 RepID=A0A9P5JY93_9AGAM|nr:integral membrane protein S linking to the trans Golgi network-domain-containing protein [Russula ochroleuca]
MAPSKVTTWDPVMIISQIVALQSLHYLTLALLVPPLLSFFAEPGSLEYEGGAFNVGMLMDWREMAGRPTFRRLHGEERWSSFTGAWSGGRKVAEGPRYMGPDGRGDYMRGWILASCWVLASTADVYYLYHLVRRPRLILDFTLTLLFNHLVLTTYYSAAIPTSLFFWIVVLGSSFLTLLLAEQMCVKREMSEGLVIATNGQEAGDVEMGALRRD